jgi:hypothetical protein
MQLARYEQARTALAEAHRVDEVKDIRDKAEAMAAYARQAKDSELIQYATEIKVRAERRCGELLSQTEKHRGGRPTGNHSNDESGFQTLAEMGLTHNESSRYQQLAAMPAEHFETAVATAKATAGEVTTAFMLRQAKAQKAPPIKTAKAEQQREQLKTSQAASQLVVYIRALTKALNEQQSLSEVETQALADLRDHINQLLEVETA